MSEEGWEVRDDLAENEVNVRAAAWSGSPSHYARASLSPIEENKQADGATLEVGWAGEPQSNETWSYASKADDAIETPWSYVANADGTETRTHVEGAVGTVSGIARECDEAGVRCMSKCVANILKLQGRLGQECFEVGGMMNYPEVSELVAEWRHVGRRIGSKG